MVSEPTSRALWGRGAGCLSAVGNYLMGTGMQTVYAVSEPTSGVLWDRVADCLSSVGTYLLGTEGQCCRLFKLCWSLLLGHCGAKLQAV